MRTNNGIHLLPQPSQADVQLQAMIQQVALQAAQQASRVNDTQLVAQLAATIYAAGGKTYLEATEAAVELVARSMLAMQPSPADGSNALSRAVDRLRAAG